MLKHTQLRLCLPALLYLGAPRSSSMATVRWADIYDNTDDDGLGPWAAYPGRPRSPSPPPQPPARGTGLRWADIYDGEDDGNLGPWASYPTSSRSPSPVPEEQMTKKTRRGKRGKKKPWKHAKHASIFPDLIQEARCERWCNNTLCELLLYTHRNR